LISRDLADAAVEHLSDDRRFATAYNAALQTAKMVIACAGFRVVGQGHHQTSFLAIGIAMGMPAEPYSLFFETCRRKRNMVDYDLSGIVTAEEVNQIREEAASFLQLAEEWIRRNHPNLG
jgi:hypothetical protein